MNNFNIIKTKLTFHEALSFIHDVIYAYFDVDENGNDIYTPYIGELGLRQAFLKYYTDYEFSDTIEDDYATIAFFNMDSVRNLVEDDQLDILISAINSEVEHKKVIIQNRKNDELSNFLRVLTDKVDSIHIPNIDEEKLNTLFQSIEDNGLNADSIVNAYLKSDFHDKNTQEILDAKNEKIISLEKYRNKKNK